MKNFITLIMAFVLVIFSSCCTTKNNCMTKDERKEKKEFVSLIENEKLMPPDTVMNIFDSVRKDLIVDIKKYQLDSLKEKMIIDSINNVRVIELGEKHIPDGYRAFFMNFEKIKNIKSKKLTPIIILSDKLIKENGIKDVMRHELYHYIDYLLGEDDYYSKSIEIQKKYLKYEESNYYRRISIILFNEVKQFYTYEQVIAVNYVSDIYLANLAYFCSSEELFARYHNMKKRMTELEIIKDINYPISIDNILELIEKDKILMKVAIKETPEYMPIILFLDMDKIIEFDKKMSLSVVK